MNNFKTKDSLEDANRTNIDKYFIGIHGEYSILTHTSSTCCHSINIIKGEMNAFLKERLRIILRVAHNVEKTSISCSKAFW